MDKKELIKHASIRNNFIEKLAFKFSKDVVQRAGTAAALIGATVLINQFVKSMLDFANDRKIIAMRPVYYKKMIEANPSLMNEDPEEVMDLWNTMYSTSPSLAQDPVAAGGFITQNINMRVRSDLGGPPLDTYSTLVDIENQLQKNRSVDRSVDFTDWISQTVV